MVSLDKIEKIANSEDYKDVFEEIFEQTNDSGNNNEIKEYLKNKFPDYPDNERDYLIVSYFYWRKNYK